MQGVLPSSTYSPDSQSPPPSATTLTDYTTTDNSSSSLDAYPFVAKASEKKAAKMNGGADGRIDESGSGGGGGNSEFWTKLEKEKQRQEKIRDKLSSPHRTQRKTSMAEGLARHGHLNGGSDGAQSAVSMSGGTSSLTTSPSQSRRKLSRSHRGTHSSKGNRHSSSPKRPSSYTDKAKGTLKASDAPARKVASHGDMRSLERELMNNSSGGVEYEYQRDDDDMGTNVTAPTIIQHTAQYGKQARRSSSQTHDSREYSKSPRSPSSRKRSVRNKISSQNDGDDSSLLKSPKPTLPRPPDFDLAIRSAPTPSGRGKKSTSRRHTGRVSGGDGHDGNGDNEESKRPSRSPSRRRRSSSRSNSPSKRNLRGLPGPPSAEKGPHDSHTSLADDIINSDDNNNKLVSGRTTNSYDDNDNESYRHRNHSPGGGSLTARRRASKAQIDSLMDEAFQSPGTRGYHQHKRRMSKISPNSLKDRIGDQPPHAPNLTADNNGSPASSSTKMTPQSILSQGKKSRMGIDQHLKHTTSSSDDAEDDDEVRSLRSKKSVLISNEPPEVRERSGEIKLKGTRPNSLQQMRHGGGAPHASSFSNHSASGRSWGSKRVIREEDVIKTEWWVYSVAALLLSITTVGLGYVVLIIFGANGSREPEYDQLLDIVSGLSPSVSEIDELDEYTPQRLALDWLVKHDEHFHTIKTRNIVVNDSTASRIKARYALAVLYYSTSEATDEDDKSIWVDRYGFLSSRHECEWNREIRDHGEDDTSNDKNGENNIGNENTVSIGGVMCDSETQQNVISLNLGRNNLRGNIPEELIGLSSLQILDLHGNVLTGTIPEWPSLGGGDDNSSFSATLLKLDLSKNFLTGTLPFTFGTYLYSLEELDVSHNMLSSTLPTSLGLMTNLKIFNVADNNMNGALPAAAILSHGGWKQLEEFNVAMNHFSGNIDIVPRGFGQETMQNLNISFNDFDATIPQDLTRMTNLRSMDISNNLMKGSLPFNLGKIGSLEKLYCASNMISGEFPWGSFSEVEGRVSLKEVDVPNNLLRGDVFISDMSRFSSTLSRVNFHGNQLSGSIPNTIGTISKLSMLDMGDNGQIGGSLPAVLGLLTSLSYLDLSGNELQSTVPFQLGNLANLKALHIEDNEFIGQLPNELSRLTLLERIELQTNLLTGDIDFLCGISSLTNIAADCLTTSTSPGVPSTSPIGCSCCSVCF